MQEEAGSEHKPPSARLLTMLPVTKVPVECVVAMLRSRGHVLQLISYLQCAAGMLRRPVDVKFCSDSVAMANRLLHDADLVLEADPDVEDTVKETLLREVESVKEWLEFAQRVLAAADLRARTMAEPNADWALALDAGVLLH
jgi:hypothetical protein